MVAKEKTNPSPEEDGKKSGSVGTDKKNVGVGFVEELVRSLKIQTLWREARQGNKTVDLKTLEKVEVDLKSNKIEVRSEAEKLWESLWEQHKTAETKVEGSTLKEVVGSLTGIDGKKKKELGDLAATIDVQLGNLKNKTVDNPTEREKLVNEIEKLSEDLGIPETLQGLDEIENRMRMIAVRSEIQSHLDNPEDVRSPLKKYKNEFGKESEDKLLKIREPLKGKDRKETIEKWDNFVAKIEKEVLSDDKTELDRLTGPELIIRLEEVSEWQTHQRALAGWKMDGKTIREQGRALEMVEAEYLVALEKRVINDVGGAIEKQGGDRSITSGIGEGLAVSLSKRRPKKRNQYNFKKDAKPNKDGRIGPEQEYESFVNDVVGESVKRKSVGSLGEERGARRPMQGSRTDMTMESELLDLDDQEKLRDDLKNRMDNLEGLLEKLGLDIKDDDLFDVTKRKEKLKVANENLNNIEGITAPERSVLTHVLHDLEAVGEMGIMPELNELLRNKHYSAFMVKLEAYIDRVGLRETSSDWQFAIMLRRAKERLSHFNSDLGGKFDLWQEGQFIPGITDVDEETFIKMIPKVLHAGRLNYELNTKYSNWVAMQAEIGDQKVNISTASIMQMMESEEVGRRILDAQINGNEGVMYQLLVEHMFGPDARLVVDTIPDGLREGETLFSVVRVVNEKVKTIVGVNDKLKINYFSVKEGSSDINFSEEMNIKDILEQSSSMANYAKKMWWWAGDWERFVADFDNDHLSQANKRLMSIGAAMRDYGLEYGKFRPIFEELVKLGVMLPPYSVYKKSDMVVKNIVHTFVDGGIGDSTRGGDVGKAMVKLAFRSVKMSESGNEYIIGKRTKEEVRLMASLPESGKDTWDWWLGTQYRLKRTAMRSYEEIQDYLKIAEERRTDVQMAWVTQYLETNAMVDELRGVKQKLVELNLKKEELQPLMKTQAMHSKGEYVEGNESLDEFLRNFEFTSVINYDEREKGSDPIDYANYFAAKKDVAKKMTEIMVGGIPTMGQIKELFNSLTGYVNPPSDKLHWFEDFMKRWVKYRTWQWSEYEVAMTDRDDYLAQQEKAEKYGIDGPTGPVPVGYATATYKVTDDRGDVWNIRGRDGMRVAKKKMTKGCEAWTKYKMPLIRIGDVEPLFTFMTASGMFPTTDMGEEILGKAFGLGNITEIFEKMYKKRNSGKKLPKWLKNSTKLGNKLIFLVRRHPLFDDPTWAFWSIANELWTYAGEVGKEVGKGAVGGH